MSQEAAPTPEAPQTKSGSRLWGWVLAIGAIIGGFLAIADRLSGSQDLLCRNTGLFCAPTTPPTMPPTTPPIANDPDVPPLALSPTAPTTQPQAASSQPPANTNERMVNPQAGSGGSVESKPRTDSVGVEPVPRTQPRNFNIPAGRPGEEVQNFTTPAPANERLTLASFSTMKPPPSGAEERICRPQVSRATGISGFISDNLTRPGNQACVEIPPGSEAELVVTLCSGRSQPVRQIDIGRQAWGGGRPRTSPATFLYSLIDDGRETSPQRIPSRPGYIHSISFPAVSAQHVRILVQNPFRGIGEPITQRVCWISVR
jgi:hypothetical protein